MTKKCSKCKSEYSLDMYCKDRTKSDGLHPHCKSCRFKKHTLYYAKNKDKIITYGRQWASENRERNLARHREYDLLNKDKIREKKKLYAQTDKGKEVRRRSVKKWQQKNKKKVAEYSRIRNPLLKKRFRTATPKWLTPEQKQEIKDIYKSCRTMSEFHEIQYHVDHIEPLNGKTSCGLHVGWNLRIIPALENRIKSNKLIN